jgi:hypothetical protein
VIIKTEKKNRSIVNILIKFIILMNISVMIYLIYKSEIDFKGLNRSNYIPYYLISLTLFLILLITYNLSKKFKTYFLITFFSISIPIYIFEITLTLGLLKNEGVKKREKLYLENEKKIFDMRSKKEVFIQALKKDKSSSVALSKNFFKIDNKNLFSLAGISNSRTIYCNENGYYSEYLSDRYGFNNPDHEWDEEKIDILLLGDSFVHGACINPPNDIASVLRRISQQSVLNLGFRGNGPVMNYATLKEYFPEKTKKIFWFYYEGNDLIDLKVNRKNKILQDYLVTNDFKQNLKNYQSKIDKITKKKIHAALNIRNYINYKHIFILHNIRLLINKNIINKDNKNLNVFFEILKKSKEFADINDSEFYLVYLPTYKRYVGNFNNQNYEKIIKFSKDNKIFFIDIHKNVFSETKNPKEFFPFEMGGHYNIKGYDVIAKYIFDKIN